MAISSNALSLADYALISNSPLILKVVNSLRAAGSIMTDIPFVTKPTLRASGARWTGNLPGVNWVPLNQAPQAVKGDPTPFEEQAFLLRNTIEVDHVLVEDQNSIQDPRAVQIEAYMEAVAYDFNDKFINNDHTSGDKNAIIGLRARLDNPGLYGTLAANKINAGGLDLTDANASAAGANQLLKWLDKLLWALGSPLGDGVTIYMNDDMQRQLPFMIRLLNAGAGFSTTEDSYGRTVNTYKGAILKDAGVKADQSSKIITSTENAAGVAVGNSTYTSMYGVRYGEGYLSGWQFAPLKAKDLGQDPVDGVVYRTFLEWIGGLFVPNIRSIARVYGLKLA